MDGLSGSGKAMRSMEAGSTSGFQGCHQPSTRPATISATTAAEPAIRVALHPRRLAVTGSGGVAPPRRTR